MDLKDPASSSLLRIEENGPWGLDFQARGSFPAQMKIAVISDAVP